MRARRKLQPGEQTGVKMPQVRWHFFFKGVGFEGFVGRENGGCFSFFWVGMVISHTWSLWVLKVANLLRVLV